MLVSGKRMIREHQELVNKKYGIPEGYSLDDKYILIKNEKDKLFHGTYRELLMKTALQRRYEEEIGEEDHARLVEEINKL